MESFDWFLHLNVMLTFFANFHLAKMAKIREIAKFNLAKVNSIYVLINMTGSPSISMNLSMKGEVILTILNDYAICFPL